MSWSSLREARQPRQYKSFLSTTTKDGPSQASEIEKVEQFHPALPSAIMDMRKSPGKGRAIYAKTIVKPGSTIISLRPRVCVLSTSHLNSFCSSCFAPSHVSKRCSKCRLVWYCNSDCQLADWSVHKAECTCLQRIASLSPDSDNPSLPPDAIRCLGRIVFLKQKHGLKSEISKEFDSMHSLKDCLPTSAHASHAQLAHALVQYLGVNSPQDLEPFGISSSGALIDLISKFATNTHSLTTPTLTPIGLAVSPLLALINHSCDPNAVLVFPRSSKAAGQEPEMHLVCLHEITPGDEITVSYIDTTLPCPRRRELLFDTYGFECKCPVCSANDEGAFDPRKALHCPNRCGGSCNFPTNEQSFLQCRKCQSRASSDVESVLDTVRICQEGLDKASLVQDEDPSRALKLTSHLIPLLTSAGLTNASHPLLALLRLQHLLLTESLSQFSVQREVNKDHQTVLDDAIRTAARVLSGLCEILPMGHPIRGLHRAETGKLLAVDESAPPTQSNPSDTFPPTGPARLQLAFRNLVEARKELLIGFGISNDGGKVGEEVREMIVSLETEMGIWKDGVKTAWDEQVTKNHI